MWAPTDRGSGIRWGEVATRTDLAALGSGLRGEMSVLSSELRGEMKAGNAELLRTLFFAIVASNATLVGLAIGTTATPSGRR